jgi:plastocyanin
MDHDLPPELAARREELLARVTKRGRALRARRLGALTTMFVLAIGVPIAAFAVMSDGDSPHVAAVAPTTTVPAATPTTGAPRAIEVVSVEPAQPRVGDTVTFTVRASAPNCGGITSSLDEPNSSATLCGVSCGEVNTDSPSSTAPTDETRSFQHVFTAAGEYPVTFTVRVPKCPDPTFTDETTSATVHVVGRRVLTTIPGSAGPPDPIQPGGTVPTETTIPSSTVP